jgi:hypothetical protein
VVFVIDWASLHRSELSSAQQRYSVPLGINCELHRRANYLLRVTQKFTSHLVREGDQGCALLRSCLVVDEQDSLRRVGIRVGITKSGVRMHRSGDGQAVERNTIPTAALDVPGENGFIAHEVHLAIGEALPSVDIGAAGLDVVTANLLA